MVLDSIDEHGNEVSYFISDHLLLKNLLILLPLSRKIPFEFLPTDCQTVPCKSDRGLKSYNNRMHSYWYNKFFYSPYLLAR